MSIFGKAPVQDIARGRDTFADHLQRALKGRTLDDVGWAQPDDLTLLVPLFGTRADNGKDAYMLRLYFDHYPTWPPSAVFVNPLTLEYKLAEDAKWVPTAPGHPEIAFHTNYASTEKQLICCSLTLEFYRVNHAVEQNLVWQGDKQTFLATIAAVKRILIQPYYQGRTA
ncbi:hypothetical protein [Bradyrhizobium tunisiense]|uniref:hypothetical protein n=1 Tax=Bradyrhizobium tunisiense TaxID=3278709 RepID=UPI0035D6EA4D